MVEIIEINAHLGARGMQVILRKISKKDGKKSGVRVGNQKNFALYGPIKTGHPINAIREIDAENPRNESRKIPVTSNVIGMRAQTKRVFEIETDTSFYSITFLS